MYLNVNMDARTTHNPHYAKFPCKLPKVVQTMPKRHAPSYAAIIAMTSHNVVLLQGTAM